METGEYNIHAENKHLYLLLDLQVYVAEKL